MLLFFIKLNLQLRILLLFVCYCLSGFLILSGFPFKKPDTRSFKLPACAQAIFGHLVS